MFQDIFLYISIPATITILTVLFEKNYWDMAGISWVIVGILKVYSEIPFLGLLFAGCGVAQYAYGYQVTKEKKKLLATMEKPKKSKLTFEDRLKASLNYLKNNK